MVGHVVGAAAMSASTARDRKSDLQRERRAKQRGTVRPKPPGPAPRNTSGKACEWTDEGWFDTSEGHEHVVRIHAKRAREAADRKADRDERQFQRQQEVEQRKQQRQQEWQQETERLTCCSPARCKISRFCVRL